MPIRPGSTNFSQHNPLLNSVPVLFESGKSIPLSFQSHFPLRDDTKKILIDFFDKPTQDKFHSSGDFPTIEAQQVMKDLKNPLKSLISGCRRWFGKK
jgi:hypothetical protein